MEPSFFHPLFHISALIHRHSPGKPASGGNLPGDRNEASRHSLFQALGFQGNGLCRRMESDNCFSLFFSHNFTRVFVNNFRLIRSPFL
jgi:hypothetical protein